MQPRVKGISQSDRIVTMAYLKRLYTFSEQYCPSHTLLVSQLIYKITNLCKFRFNRSSKSGENNGKTHSCFMKCVQNKSVVLANDNWYCFNVFSKSKALHGIIFQEKSFTMTFCKPCKLFVNLWTVVFFVFFLSVPKVYNGFKGSGHYW